MESDDEEDETNDIAMVVIGNLRIPYNDVTEDMVGKMTPSERDAYIQLGQEIYEDMYDWCRICVY